MPTLISLNANTLNPAICEARLTLETGVSVSTTDQLAKTTVFLTPYKGNRIALYDGTNWGVHALASDLSLPLGTLTAALPYDVFCYSNAGDATLELLAWTNATTRATALAFQDGIAVKTGALTRRYLGTFYTASTTTTADSGGLTGTTQVGGTRFLWNYYNQVRRPLKVIDTTNTWVYTTATWRQANAAGGNRVEYVQGVLGNCVEAQAQAAVVLQGSTAAASVGVGVDSTTTPSGVWIGGYYDAAGTNIIAPVFGKYVGDPGIGYHALNWIEIGGTGTGSTFLGDNNLTNQQSGLVATLYC